MRSHKDRVPLLLHWFKPRVWCFESLIHFYSDVSFMIVGERRESKRKGWLLLLLLLLKVKTNCKMSQQKEFSYTQFNTRIDSSTRIFEVILWLCFYWIQLWRFSSDGADIHTLIAVSKKFFASWVSFLSVFCNFFSKSVIDNLFFNVPLFSGYWNLDLCVNWWWYFVIFANIYVSECLST